MKNGQEVAPNTRLGRLYTPAEAREPAGLFTCTWKSAKNLPTTAGCASWLTRTELNEYFTGPAAFTG